MPEQKRPPKAKITDGPTSRTQKPKPTSPLTEAANPPAKRSPRVKPAAPDAPSKRPQAATPAAAKRRTRVVKPAAQSTGTPAGAPLRVLMVSSEAHPFAKSGGLAEVAGALPDALARLGHTVTLVVPGYRGTIADRMKGQHATFSMGARAVNVTFHERVLKPGITAVLVDVPDLFDRPGLYGEGGSDYPDNAWRFAVFSRAALEYARIRGERPSVIHAHDWQTGLVPVYQKMHLPNDPVVGGVPSSLRSTTSRSRVCSRPRRCL